MERFRDRAEAGELLGAALLRRSDLRNAVVLALPRGGVAVAAPVARALGAPLDILIVRKLGLPGQPELAIGAIASGDVLVVNHEVVEELGLPHDLLERVAVPERAELARRERAYRGDRPGVDVRGRPVVLVDDGVATGSTMRAAIQALRALGPARIVVAVPTAPPDVCDRLRRGADDVVCLRCPEPFHAISLWYDEFPQLEDDEVRTLLAGSSSRVEPRPGEP